MQHAGDPFVHVQRCNYNCNPKYIPGLNNVCKQTHTKATEAYLLWRVNSKPKYGTLLQCMSKTRAKFKYLLRKCKPDEDQHKAESLTKTFVGKVKNFMESS